MTHKDGPSRRGVLTGAMALAASAALSDVSRAAPMRKPPRPRGRKLNLLFILADQERSFADVPSLLPLPAHDWVRARGVSFENFHVNTNPCGPSRSVIYSGQHTQKTGVYLNPNTPPEPKYNAKIPTVGHMLRAAGYKTYYKGKWHISNINAALNFRSTPDGVYPDGANALEPFGFGGFNFNGERIGLSWDGFINDPVTASDAINALNAFKDGDEPWFMAVNFVNPHDIMFYDPTGNGEKTRATPRLLAPLLPPPGDPLYQVDWKIDLPKSFYLDDLSTKPRAHGAIASSQWTMYGKMPRSDIASWHRHQNYYFNCIRDVDRSMKLVLDALEKNGQLEDTIIIFTADHGERGSAHGMRQKAGTAYKEDIRVPFVIIHPDIKGGVTTKALGSTVDIAPTLLSFAGLSAGEIASRYPALKGHDLSPIIHHTSAKTARDREGILLNYACGYGWAAPDPIKGVEFSKPLPKPDLMLRRLYRGVFDGRYKFARYFAPAQHHTPKTWEQLSAYNDLELYDTQADPDEIVNLAFGSQDYKDEILRLNAKVNALVAREIGEDIGREYSGPVAQYNTLTL